jgi:predicted methyltransferase
VRSIKICSTKTLGIVAASVAFATPTFADGNIESALSNPMREQADIARDENRKPADLIKFMESGSGDAVLDLMSGGGYYTEVLSGVVGSEGKVVAHVSDFTNGRTNNALINHVAEEGRMENVEVMTADLNDLQLEENQFDAIYMVLGFHDFYYVDDDWKQVEISQVLHELHEALKPGGSIVVVDHAAAADASDDPEQGPHSRIGRSVMLRKFLAAGFKFAAEADFLENPEDDGTRDMFDPTIRGETNRYIVKFVR